MYIEFCFLRFSCDILWKTSFIITHGFLQMGWKKNPVFSQYIMKIYKWKMQYIMQITCILQFIKLYYLKFNNCSLGISKNLQWLCVTFYWQTCLSLIMTIELSGVNSGLKLYLWFQVKLPLHAHSILKSCISICVGSHDLRVHFGMNQLKQIFQRLTKLHELVGWVQFVVFEKFKSSDLCQISEEKSYDYLLII